MQKREWCTGSYRTYSIPSKTAALIPEFVMEDLPSAEMQPRFLRLQNTHDDDDDIYRMEGK